MNPNLILRVLIFVLILLALDLYVFQGIKAAFSRLNPKARQVVFITYWLINVALIIAIVYSLATFSRTTGPKLIFTKIIAALILFTVPKLILVIFLFIEDLFRLGYLSWTWIYSFFSKTFTVAPVSPVWVERRIFLNQAALAVASIPFLSILYGITKGKYNYKVHRVTLYFKDLPAAFDGFTITQLSDIHAGSFDNFEKVREGVELANSQNSDLIVFTGDLVNNKAEEMNDWVDLFKQLKAKHGKFSVLGNHDYGDYIHWPSRKAKEDNMKVLEAVHAEMGFRLLKNESSVIEKEDVSIALVGVENWGLPPFPQKGNIDMASRGVEEKFKIVLSHDPTHWDQKIKNSQTHFHLTLSGHTHGMQFGIEIPGFRWSPVKYRYPKWADLYEESGKYLYINRGFGFLGFPGRVGIWPEVTVITIRNTQG